MQPRIFVDTNVWYPPSTRALVCGSLYAGVASFGASQGVLDELYEHLSDTTKTNLEPRHASARVNELEHVLLEIPGGFVSELDEGSSFEPLGLTDPEDEHVVAAALDEDADLLLTLDEGLLADAERLAAVGLDILPPDDFFAPIFAVPGEVGWMALRRALTMPPKGVQSAADLGRALYSAGLPVTGGRLTQASWQ